MMTWWNRIEQTLVGLLGACALIVGVVQVIGRYFDPEHAISWAEEVIVYLVIWAIMIVSSQLVRTDGHVRPDLVLRLLPPQAPALGGDVQLPRGARVLRRHGLVRLGDRRHRAAARRAQLDRPAVPDVDLLPRAAGRRGC